MPGFHSNIQDVQERWIDAREEFDAFEKKKWREEGEAARDAAARKAVGG
jgi:hypothetical protein